MSNKRRILRGLGVRVSEIGFGAWAIGGSSSVPGYGPTNDAASSRAVARALDLGCNFFDTADCYGRGHSELLLGKALRAKRSDVIIAGKVGIDFYHGVPRSNFHPAYLRFALHQSLRRLGSDYIDLYQLHNPHPSIMCDPEVIAAMERFRSQGKVRWIGVSAESPEEAAEAIRAGWPQAVQVPYNILAPEAEHIVFPLAVESGVAILAREPLANGLLTGKYRHGSQFDESDFRRGWSPSVLAEISHPLGILEGYRRTGETLAQLALRFVLDSPAVSVAICGCKTPAQVSENLTQICRC